MGWAVREKRVAATIWKTIGEESGPGRIGRVSKIGRDGRDAF